VLDILPSNRMNHLPTITRTAFHDIYVTVLCVLGGPTGTDNLI
jgi:hypothetical protein